MAFNRLEQCVATPGEQGARPPHVALEMSLTDEACQHDLSEGRCVTVGKPLRGPKGPDEHLRKDDIAEAEGGEEDLGKCPDIDHTPTSVEPLHGLNRPAPIPIFTLIVVFNDVSSGL